MDFMQAICGETRRKESTRKTKTYVWIRWVSDEID
jgi:hypothetical protein